MHHLRWVTSSLYAAEYEGLLRVHALREDARERALAHLGISSGTDSVPWGMQISTLVKKWEMTSQVVLTPAMKTVRLYSLPIARSSSHDI